MTIQTNYYKAAGGQEIFYFEDHQLDTVTVQELIQVRGLQPMTENEVAVALDTTYDETPSIETEKNQALMGIKNIDLFMSNSYLWQNATQEEQDVLAQCRVALKLIAESGTLEAGVNWPQRPECLERL